MTKCKSLPGIETQPVVFGCFQRVGVHLRPTWFDGGGDGGLGLPHPLHHVLQLLGCGLGRQLWGLHAGVVGMVNPERDNTRTTALGAFTSKNVDGLESNMEIIIIILLY